MKKKILLIEDDKFIADLYKRVLKSTDYELDYAADGELGYQKIEQGKYDLILLDLMLPGKNGVDVLKDLKNQDNKTPVLVLSNLGEDKIVEECLNMGAIGFLLKSSNTPREVLAKIDQFFDKK